MARNNKIVVIGGGLAGLSAAIHLAICGQQVTLFEKEMYPHHKVCGEYLSKEVLPYLKFLGVDLGSSGPVEIDKLFYSTPSGKEIHTRLPLGGIGISRYTLDEILYKKAVSLGIEVKQEEVKEIEFDEGIHKIKTSHSYTEAGIVLGAYGKRDALDRKLHRPFIQKKTGWLAIKAHYQMNGYPRDTVSLHNFKGGYCGLSMTETGAINVCYLATYSSFKDHKDPEVFKEKVLRKNRHLAQFFSKATSLFEKDLTIAQISFDRKALIEDHILMLGDSAALIHPLCGNGMAMAIHSAKLASEAVMEYLVTPGGSRENLEHRYEAEWNRSFKSRINTGRMLQKVLLNPALAEISQNTVQLFPGLLPHIIKRTHGIPVE
ncbi:NAD(P)/FAD-dependent oxidoreductase [Antarcticibacterium flavum]|uniref:NAD(P)/FAD-dependent oxidoreductase n=1 Tax=Antarcticibacterium flavum TaxID=2058175 RepID=A0A5B7X0D5_9FLAO|nr:MULTISPECIES: NAD(P)/FAD-dependent oxidoreductase [Antarcticibacterium]MCM4158871.1 FAD-dependent oxidoreductase [Antarcticibacterium sp. W02-3]QCY68128.1 NAD(P)/FAD-dependent oxidoreductase [Antarcticibacterium flavum]